MSLVLMAKDEPILEQPYKRLTADQLTVWDQRHPQPPSGRGLELKLLQWLSRDSDRQIQMLTPTDGKSLARYREIVGTAWDILLRGLPADAKVRQSLSQRPTPRGKYRETIGAVKYHTVEGHQARVPVVQLDPPAPHLTNRES